MKLQFVAIALAATLAGCASVPMGDAKQDAELKKFAVAPDKARIYVYRNEALGAGVKMDVTLDGEKMGQTAAKTYLSKEVTPGKHTLTSEAENTDTLDIDVKAGTLSYVWQEVKMGVLYARNKLHIMSETDGQKGVQETSLAVSK